MENNSAAVRQENAGLGPGELSAAADKAKLRSYWTKPLRSAYVVRSALVSRFIFSRTRAR